MACTRSVGNQNRRIAGPARTRKHGNVAAGDIASAVDEFPHRPPTAGAEIERRAFCTVQQCACGCNVSIRQIGHMDVIAHTGTICGRIIVPEYRKSLAISRGRLEQQRNGMGFRNVALADLTLWVSALAL